MAQQFKYSARDGSGKTVTGTLKAGSENDVAGELRRKNLTPVDIQKVAGAKAGRRRKARPSCKKGELVIFTRQLATMLSSGIPILESLEIPADQAESPGFRVCLDQVVEDIRGGMDLSKAITKFPRIFTPLFVSMIHAGEASGQIDTILVRLAEYLEAAQKLKQEI